MADRRPWVIAALATVGLGAVAYKMFKAPPPIPSVVLVSPTPSLTPSPVQVEQAVAVPNSNLPQMTIFPFARLQTVAVPPQSSATVFLGTIPGNYAAIIQYVGNTYPFSIDALGNTAFHYDWTVDGDLVERVERIIADPNSPKQLDPAIMATQEIRWTGYNSHPTQSVLATVLMDGFMRLRTDV